MSRPTDAIHCYFILSAFFFVVGIRQADDADVRHRVSGEEERESERERGRATRDGGCGEGSDGREKSFNVKVTWAHAHRIDHTQKRDKAEAVVGGRKGSCDGGKGGPASLGRMLSPVGIRDASPGAASGR